jgi:hypothetical protein
MLFRPRLGGGFLFTVSSLGASPVGLNYYSLMLPRVLLTAIPLTGILNIKQYTTTFTTLQI